ncbi:mandelate racemase/muconate lactonizing enzyme family protein [Streptomyces sp. NPDC047028]|uniref:mandelate racemase/muconate lactonizing enzyme family protein n=1 Tax=Streptomyces sp. NPDC047028 TaxID=3155793 RepID=UPI0033DBEB70
MGTALELFTYAVSDRTQWRVVRITTPNGRTGLGEMSDSGPLPEAVAALDMLEDFIGTAVAEPLTEPDDVRRWADKALGLVPPTRWGRTVVGGVEQALCDLAARGHGMPVWRWLGGRARRRVPVYANINRFVGGREPGDVARAALEAVKNGHTAIKFAPFDVPAEGRPLAEVGLARLTALREAVGEGISLMVDCHERLPLEEVGRILPALRDLNVCWLEDATDIEDVEGLSWLRRSAGDMILAGGEFAHDARQIHPAVTAGVIDVVMPDVKHAGGITRAAAMLAAVPDVRVAPHNPTGPVGTAAGAHLFLACPSAISLEVATGEVPWRPSTVRPAEWVEDAHLTVPEGPGLGISLDFSRTSARLVWSTTPLESQ